MPPEFASGVPPFARLAPRLRSALVQLELLVDDLLEHLERLGAAQQASVDVEGWRPDHARFLTRSDVGVDRRLVLVRVDARVELAAVHAEVDGALLEIRIAELR